MNNKFQELAERLPQHHRDIAMYVKHVNEALDNMVGEHNKIIYLNALAGIKPNIQEDREFYNQIATVRRVLLDELEKTTQDFEHQGDKYWAKNYRDGVEER